MRRLGLTALVLLAAAAAAATLLCFSQGPAKQLGRRCHEAALTSALADADALAPATAAALSGVAADAMRHVGWRAGVRFAAFDGTASLDGVLSNPADHAGAFLLIVPGSGSLQRRADGQPLLSVDPAAGDLAAALAPAAAALDTAAAAVEAALGRRLFAFRVDTAPLPPCASGAGPCAIWEASSGRVVLDAVLAARIGGTAEHGGSSGLPHLLAGFVERLAALAAPATALMQGGQASLPALAGLFARAAPAALLAAAGPPLWWCIVCPVVLGMLAPWVFNLGLTAAAEALCAQLQLPADTCTDLWWGAFALALMLSLGSAIPIVYLCRLPECGRHAAAAVAAGGLAVARLVAS